MTTSRCDHMGDLAGRGVLVLQRSACPVAVGSVGPDRLATACLGAGTSPMAVSPGSPRPVAHLPTHAGLLSDGPVGARAQRADTARWRRSAGRGARVEQPSRGRVHSAQQPIKTSSLGDPNTQNSAARGKIGCTVIASEGNPVNVLNVQALWRDACACWTPTERNSLWPSHLNRPFWPPSHSALRLVPSPSQSPCQSLRWRWRSNQSRCSTAKAKPTSLRARGLRARLSDGGAL